MGCLGAARPAPRGPNCDPQTRHSPLQQGPLANTLGARQRPVEGGSCLEPRSGGQPHAGSLPVHCSRGPVSWSRAQPRHGGLARWKPRRACHTAVVARHRRSGAGSGGQGARIHTPRPPASTPPPPIVTRAGGR